MVPTAKIGSRGVQLFLQIPALAQMIQTHRPRAIYSAGNQSNLSLALAGRLAGNPDTKIIQKITNPIERPGPKKKLQWIRDWRFGLTSALGDKTFVLSQAAAKNYARQYPKSQDKFIMAHLACITDAMMAIGQQRKPRNQDNVPQFLAAGRLVIQKDYVMMFEALALLKCQSWELTIIGDGPQRDELEQLAQRLGIADRIDFVGFVSDPAPYFAAADLLLLSSRWEGLGAVAVEAYATGVPVAATDCCEGLDEIIHSAGYDTTPVGDATAFAGSISQILERQVDLERLLNIAHPYHLESAVAEHLELLAQIE
jgi:glycosyltransferase involved in cell wall biosynthesis